MTDEPLYLNPDDPEDHALLSYTVMMYGGLPVQPTPRVMQDLLPRLHNPHMGIVLDGYRLGNSDYPKFVSAVVWPDQTITQTKWPH